MRQRNDDSDRMRAKALAAIAKADAKTHRDGLRNTGGMTPYFIRHADNLVKRVDDWIAAHR